MLTASCIFILLGALCLIGGKAWQFGISKEEKYKGKAVGTVAEIVAGPPDQDGLAAGIHDYYYPIVAFYAKSRLYKVKYHKGNNPPEYIVREKLQIRYNENDPTEFEIYKDKVILIMAKIMYYMGFLFCCVGGIFFLLFATRG